ncbi:hypothetical protein A343_2377 [Porphyromonas gingivalis JCVI SC001]|nr:hypothetical protein A343_2377 [Porphyromonas gingivalis JCVI SC001]
MSVRKAPDAPAESTEKMIVHQITNNKKTSSGYFKLQDHFCEQSNCYEGMGHCRC